MLYLNFLVQNVVTLLYSEFLLQLGTILPLFRIYYSSSVTLFRISLVKVFSLIGILVTL